MSQLQIPRILANAFSPVERWGIAAQGTPNPDSAFTDHELNRIQGKIFDPSYGRQYASFDEWEGDALEAVGVQNLNPAFNFSFWAGVQPLPNRRETQGD